jgi:hypothetical protein
MMPLQSPSPSPTLLECWLEIVRPWRLVFAQQRTFLRAIRQGLGSPLCLGRSTLSRIIWTTGREQKSWSGEYFLHSRAEWSPQALFEPMVREALQYCPGRLVGVAVDDTRLKKTGRAIPQAQYHRDPLSPPFHVNLIWALRFLQASVLLPLHRSGPWSGPGIPTRFEEVSSVKKPSRRAGEEAWKAYKQEVKLRNLSRRFVQSMGERRATFDNAGAQKKVVLYVGEAALRMKDRVESPDASVRFHLVDIRDLDGEELLLQKRFGLIPSAVSQRISASKPAQLKRVGRRLLDAQRIEDLFAR